METHEIIAKRWRTLEAFTGLDTVPVTLAQNEILDLLDRIAELEAQIAMALSMVEDHRLVIEHKEETHVLSMKRIAELEDKLATSEQLAEQHLMVIDGQAQLINELTLPADHMERSEYESGEWQ